MRFIPKEKLSKKAKRELARAKRQSWAISPVTRTAENKKRYDRKRSGFRFDDYGSRIFVYSGRAPFPPCAGCKASMPYPPREGTLLQTEL